MLNFLQGLASGFREHEEDVEEHGEAENSKYDVDFPFDVLECWRYKVPKREVECPICAGAYRDGFAAHSEGE